jgi:galactose oxidase
MPIVPVAAANLPNGKVLTWSAYAPDNYGTENGWGRTYSAIFDPLTLSSESRVVTETEHDMFCPGTTMLGDGRILINGGSSSQKTTIYDPVNNSWNMAEQMNIARGYPGNTILSDGSTLTLGGAWSGGPSEKNGEIWAPGSGWRAMAGIPIAPFIGPDPRGTYRGDNHAWLFAQPNGRVFHAGPSADMHWIETSGSGKVTSAGTRGDDSYSMNGNAVMYDVGKILKTGGAPAYEDTDALSSAYVIDLNSTTTRKLAPMNYARSMHNSVVLPNGQVVIAGGQTYVKLFSDDRSVLMAELWDPKTESFTKLSPMQIPRNYHSVGLLLPDGRVMVGGGGLCGDCGTNHPNVEILTPPYLLNADGSAAARPTITSAPTTGRYGESITVVTDSPVKSFALMRLSAVTHSLNNDQRRVPVQSSSSDGRSHLLQIPNNPGIAPPGYYMLFAMNANGVPSVATTVHIR